MEIIICSAIHYNDGLIYQEQPLNITSGIVVAGRRHNNAFMTLTQLKPDYKSEYIDPMFGFITSNNRYVGRHEGYKIALKAGQVKEKTPTQYIPFGLIIEKEDMILISEDLFKGFD